MKGNNRGRLVQAELDDENRSSLVWTGIDSLKLIIGSKSRLPSEFIISADYHKNDPVATHVEVSPDIILSDWTLGYGFPNPFNSNISIPIESMKNQSVELSVFNAYGQKVRSLYEGWLSSGSHQFSWDGKDESGYQLASGQYQVLLRLTRRDEIRSIVLLK